ncbi:hypothetical protein ISCGN_010846 [Ixodes scapularis]
MRTPKSPLRPLADASTSTTFPSERRDVKKLRRQTENADADAKKSPTTAGRREHFDDIPFGETRRQETAPTNRKRRCGRQKAPYDRWPTRALRRHSLRRDATSRNCADKPKTPMRTPKSPLRPLADASTSTTFPSERRDVKKLRRQTEHAEQDAKKPPTTAGRREHFDDIPFGETRRQETAPINRTRRTGRQKVPYDRWPTRALRRHSLRRDATSRNCADKPNTPMRTPKSPLRPLADASTSTTFPSERRDVKKLRRPTENADADAKKPPTTAGRREHFDDIPFGETRRQETAPTNRKRRCGRQKAPTTAGRREHFDDIPFGETRRQETAPTNRKRRCGRQKVPYDRWPTRALRRHSLRRDATSRNCADKPKTPMRTPKSPLRPLADASTSTTFPSERRDVKKLRRQTENADADAKKSPTTAGRREHFDDIPFGETRRQETAPTNRKRRCGRQKVPYDRWPTRALRRHSLRRDATSRNCADKPKTPMRTPKSPLRPLADASTSTTFPSERRDVKKLRRQTENADADAKKSPTTAGRREHFDDIPFGETRRQETAPTNRKRRCGRQKVPYDRWPTRALRRHSLRRDATSRNCADKPKRRCGRQKVPYDRWPTRALRRHSLRRDATSRNCADKPKTPMRTPKSPLRPLADASTSTTFPSERRDVKKLRRQTENADADAKKSPTTAGRREHFDDIPFGETRRQETAPINRTRRCGRQKNPYDRWPTRALRRHSLRRDATSRNCADQAENADADAKKPRTTAGRREHFDDIPFGETRRQETAPTNRKRRCGRQKVPYDRWPTRALRRHSLRRDATSRNCADKPNTPMRTPKKPLRPLADASTSTTFPSERRDVKKLRRPSRKRRCGRQKVPYDRWPTRALRRHSLRRDATSRNCADQPKTPMRTPKSPVRPLADASTSTTFPSERRDVKKLRRQTENADADAKKSPTTAGRREHFDDIPFGETRRQETAPINRTRRCGRQKNPYDRWPTRALRRHSLRRDATSRNCADQPKTPMRTPKSPYDRWPTRALRRHSLRRDATSRNCADQAENADADAKKSPTTAGRREHFDDIPFGETRRQETAPTNRKCRCGRQKNPYDRWPTRALRRHSLRRDATSRNCADQPKTPMRTPKSPVRPLADASTSTTFPSERRDVKKLRRQTENADADAKKPLRPLADASTSTTFPSERRDVKKLRRQTENADADAKKSPTTAGRREHFDDIPFGETRRQETAPTKPKTPMRTPKSPLRPLADASTSTTFPSERRDVKKLRR